MDDAPKEEVETMKDRPAKEAVICPVCGAETVQEKCKVICKSDICRGRVVYNCAEF